MILFLLTALEFRRSEREPDDLRHSGKLRHVAESARLRVGPQPAASTKTSALA